MKSLYDWAEQECRTACMKENPKFDFDKDEFDYGCSCYKSALKAFKSLLDDGHSGASFGFTRNILVRLLDGHPLSPITDEDFVCDDGFDEDPIYLKNIGLKSRIQCPRMPSLFREETIDGQVRYRDVDRSVCVDIEHPSDYYSSGMDRIVDEMFPITMPYMPKQGRYELHIQTFLTDKKNGDFDTKGLLYLITPEGKKVDVNIFETEKDGKMTRISKDEYEALLEKRIDKLSGKIADHLIWTLISNSSSDEVIEQLEAAYAKVDDKKKETYFNDLATLCQFYEKGDNYKYNTFNVEQKLCKGDLEGLSDKPELVAIAEYLKKILSELPEE